jgi:hypothetical protein
MKINHLNKNKGFTLLFSTLVASLILVIAMAIANISLQQFLLSSAGRESQRAFYYADTGIDCAQYYDRKSPGGFNFPTPDDKDSTGPIDCGADLVSGEPTITSTNSNNTGTTTSIYKINPSDTCDSEAKRRNPSFEIQVEKGKVREDVYFTIIRARGYNTCDINNPRRVERGLLIRY